MRGRCGAPSRTAVGGVDHLGGDRGDGGVLRVFRPGGRPTAAQPPLVTACMTRDWKLGGMPMARRRSASWPVSWPLTIAPSTATPNTAPSSRLVLVAEAAMPDRSGGITDDRGGGGRHEGGAEADPGQGHGPGQGENPDRGPISARVRTMPAAPTRHPTAFGHPGTPPCHDRPGQRRGCHQGDRHGQEVGGGLEGRHSDHDLQVQGGEEEEGEGAEVGREHDHRGHTERREPNRCMLTAGPTTGARRGRRPRAPARRPRRGVTIPKDRWPATSPWITPNESAPSATAPITMPGTSMRRPARSDDSGTKGRPGAVRHLRGRGCTRRWPASRPHRRGAHRSPVRARGRGPPPGPHTQGVGPPAPVRVEMRG